LKITNFRSSFGKIPKIPVLELVANKIGLGDTFLDYKLFVTAELAYIWDIFLKFRLLYIGSIFRKFPTEFHESSEIIPNGNSGSRESREFPHGDSRWP